MAANSYIHLLKSGLFTQIVGIGLTTVGYAFVKLKIIHHKSYNGNFILRPDLFNEK
jgi:hypothetical protein